MSCSPPKREKIEQSSNVMVFVLPGLWVSWMEVQSHWQQIPQEHCCNAQEKLISLKKLSDAKYLLECSQTHCRRDASHQSPSAPPLKRDY